MKPLFFSKSALVSFVFLCFWLMLSTPLSAAGLYEEDVSSQDYLFVKGMIHTISSEARSITIQQKKGPKIKLRISPDTEFEGVKKYEELQVRQVIKVWYRPEPGGNTALKIVKTPDLGC